jgi:dsRNA-specific ribonuclease
LTAESAIAHLHHFCDTLPHLPYVDLHPTFTFSEDKETHLINATVVLPSCLSSPVRRKSGLRWWRTEHAAMKDAAFQAYVGLYRADLLTDNLLPFPHERVVEWDAADKLPSTIEIQAQFNPWVELGKAIAQPDLHQTRVSIRQHNKERESDLRVILRTPFALPPIWPTTLYWDSGTTLTARFEKLQQERLLSPDSMGLVRDITHTLLRSVHSDYMPDDRKDFVALFTPEISQKDFEKWLKANRGRRLALQEFHLHRANNSLGLVRTSLLHGIPHIFHKWHTSTDIEEIEKIEVQAECLPLTKRRNFLRPATLSDKTIDQADHSTDDSLLKALLFPANSCTIDLLPFEQAKSSLFIPSILHHVEVVMVATQLRQTVLNNVPFTDIQHVVEATTASSAQWVTNYQRYEFVGDSILKFVISSQLFVDHKNWHEGYLSESRASLVSNTCLARAALDAGLDAFIQTKPFTAKHWTPPLISNAENYSPSGRSISSKTLADVVEALIGAAFVDGGLSVATTCIQTFLPDARIQSPESLFGGHAYSAQGTNSPIIAKSEMVIGYRFLDKALLLEALTHPSCERDSVTESYQRLEFLGDAVLDMIIVSILSKHKPYRSHGDMTMIKAALVNADLLAFFCLEFSITCDRINIQQKNSRQFCETHTSDEMELWGFMRHHSQEIMAAQQACLRRHQDLRQGILNFIARGSSYPWDFLAQLNADKFFSDIIESIFGAIFVDSGGNLVDCQRFAERIGILPYLLRILTDDIKVIHPKNALGHLVRSETVDYIVSCEENASGLYRCLVRINDLDIIAVGECLTKDEAIVRAADAAVKLISESK